MYTCYDYIIMASMAFREQQLVSTHSRCYDYIIIAAAMYNKHQNCAVATLNSSIIIPEFIMPEFFSENDDNEIPGGEFIATPGDSTVKYFSDRKNMKITGGRFITMERTKTTQPFGEASSNATRSSTFSQDGSDGYSHPRQGTRKTEVDQQGPWSSAQFRLHSLTPRQIVQIPSLPMIVQEYEKARELCL